MHPAILHGQFGHEVVTELYFVIFAAFKESVTLDLAQRSFKVIHCGGNRSLCTALIVTAALSSTISEISPVLYAQSQFFHAPLLFRLQHGVFAIGGGSIPKVSRPNLTNERRRRENRGAAGAEGVGFWEGCTFPVG